MTAVGAGPRPLSELTGEDAGQAVTEWLLITTMIVIPLGLLEPTMLKLLHYYFYRIAGVVSLPFP